MMEPIQIKTTDNILIVAPHPDDECIGCGGVLACYGSQCDVVVVTDGSRGSRELSPSRIKMIREREFYEEIHSIKVNEYRMLSFADGELFKHPDCFKDLDFTKYDVVFLPWVNDNHPDHTATYVFAKKRLKDQNAQARVYQYEVHVPFSNPDSMIDITDVIDSKVELIRFHKSQIKYICYDQKAIALAKYRSCSENKPEGYLETFKKTDIYVENDSENEVLIREKKLAKNEAFINLLSKWVENSQSGWNVSQTLKRLGYNNVSIFGFSNLGRLVYLDCIRNGFAIIDILDNRGLNNYDGEHMVKKPDEGNREAECVIVSVIIDDDSVCDSLKELGFKNVISLRKIVQNEIDK